MHATVSTRASSSFPTIDNKQHHHTPLVIHGGSAFDPPALIYALFVSSILCRTYFRQYTILISPPPVPHSSTCSPRPPSS